MAPDARRVFSSPSPQAGARVAVVAVAVPRRMLVYLLASKLALDAALGSAGLHALADSHHCRSASASSSMCGGCSSLAFPGANFHPSFYSSHGLTHHGLMLCAICLHFASTAVASAAIPRLRVRLLRDCFQPPDLAAPLELSYRHNLPRGPPVTDSFQCLTITA